MGKSLTKFKNALKLNKINTLEAKQFKKKANQLAKWFALEHQQNQCFEANYIKKTVFLKMTSNAVFKQLQDYFFELAVLYINTLKIQPNQFS